MTLMPVAMVSHDQKSHVTPHFDHPYPRNEMVLFTMPSVSCDAGANDVTWPKKSCCTSFWSSWPRKCNNGMNNTVYIIQCWCQCQWLHVTNKVMLHLTSIIFILKYNGAIYDAVSIMWHWHWCQYHYVMPMAMKFVSHDQKVMLYLIFIVLM